MWKKNPGKTQKSERKDGKRKRKGKTKNKEPKSERIVIFSYSCYCKE
jgi:hypothetical protein